VSNTGMTTSAAPTILEVKGLGFRYPEHTLFSNWSASLSPGVTLVLGGDGRGKTTLLRLLAGELTADEGELNISGIKLKTHAKDYRLQVFWTEPRTDAFDQMKPAQYFDLQRRTHASFDEGMLARCVDGLALAPELNKQLFMLSTGSKRKVWLAAAFASGAALTLLDMPFAALDKASIIYVLSLLEGAANHPARAFVLADYAAPAGVTLAGLIDLGD
jgi:ABC-type multidrug transport system ATPase subunit